MFSWYTFSALIAQRATSDNLNNYQLSSIILAAYDYLMVQVLRWISYLAVYVAKKGIESEERISQNLQES